MDADMPSDGPVWLFAPAHVARKAEGALASAADVVVLDLEDAVPAREKQAAREALSAWANLPRRGAAVFARVNAIGTPHCLRDIEAAVAAGVDGIVLPKTESDNDVATACWALQQFEAERGQTRPTALLPLIETARGLAGLGVIRWGERVRRVAFGSVDYEADLGLAGATGQDAVTFARHAMVLASRAAGLGPPIDGVTLDVRDAASCERDAAAARGIGFEGKLAIHPAQIEPIQAAFRPTQAELAWAAEVLARFGEAERDGVGAILVGGRLVDAPVVLQARRMLKRGGQA